jgi:hypothetical protein
MRGALVRSAARDALAHPGSSASSNNCPNDTGAARWPCVVAGETGKIMITG